MEQSVGIMGMPGVGFFGMLIIGFLAGYVAEKAMNREHGLFTNILVGIAGSFIGGTLAGVLGLNYQGFAGNLIVAIAGAVILLWIFGRAKASGVN
ncbi:GlsB/YeaQ/YmgE family stress response membrane protein [Mesorhizobium sp. KR9-304]|uniref:GlsB/YeaQ/YmgE family stress response membrane protein n=1 Tax=Mesorhizobium sp. KR9-304 TaxID=3156614 RepID=UPI0032B62358